MSPTLEHAPHMPVPPPPGELGAAPPAHAPAARPAPRAATSPLVLGWAGEASAASALDLDERLLDASALTRPASRPPRPRPISPPSSIEEAELRRQQRWAAGIAAGFGLVSLATLASWFI